MRNATPCRVLLFLPPFSFSFFLFRIEIESNAHPSIQVSSFNRESSFYFLITYDDIKSGRKDGGGEGKKKGKRAREEKLREGREKINGRSKKATESSVIFRKSTNYVF